MTIFKRGEVWVVNFNPGRGTEQQGIRPGLIIQNDIGNQFASTMIIAAITTTLKKYPVTVLIEEGKAGLKKNSMVNLSQILTIDKSRLIKKLGKLEENKIQEVDNAIKVSLGLIENGGFP
jgi:mRNA interferase MazF